jgi:hypothetical protein
MSHGWSFAPGVLSGKTEWNSVFQQAFCCSTVSWHVRPLGGTRAHPGPRGTAGPSPLVPCRRSRVPSDLRVPHSCSLGRMSPTLGLLPDLRFLYPGGAPTPLSKLSHILATCDQWHRFTFLFPTSSCRRAPTPAILFLLLSFAPQIPSGRFSSQVPPKTHAALLFSELLSITLRAFPLTSP